MFDRSIAIGLFCALAWTGCATTRSSRQGAPGSVVHFDPVLVQGDLEFEKLNDEELFATGTSAFAAGEHARAARAFGRIADFHPQSRYRRQALYNAGLALEKLKKWDEAQLRFAELADAKQGQGDALDAAFRLAETYYHSDHFPEASELLAQIAARADLPVNKRLEAQVQQGICQLESGASDTAEATLRQALATYQSLADPTEVEDYFPAQAQFFLGEIYRLRYEGVQLDPDKTAEELGTDLEYKSELLLSAQGHYLRAIRLGNGYWATAAGGQIGGLYENLYDHMAKSPNPRGLNEEQSTVYRGMIRRKIRILISKAIDIYERTLEAAERIGAQSPFVERTRDSLRKMKDLLLVEAKADEGEEQSTGPSTDSDPSPHALPIPGSG